MADHPTTGSAPVTKQIGGQSAWQRMEGEPVELRDASQGFVLDAAGKGVPFGRLYREQKAIVVFVRHFLCYACKEYVEDLGKIPKTFLQADEALGGRILGWQNSLQYYRFQEGDASFTAFFTPLQDANVKLVVIGQSSHHHIKPFCHLTGYSHEMYVDPERELYRILGMKRGEASITSVQSAHVKSNLLSGSIKSMWRAMTSPAFDFQGDPAQQGGTLILGPGNKVCFAHFDRNRLDHAPINSVLQLAGVQTVNFTNRAQIIDV